MAHIICRYRIGICHPGVYEWDGKKCPYQHEEYGHENCEEYKGYTTLDGRTLVAKYCLYMFDEKCGFEKDVKKWSYDQYDLTIGRTRIGMDSIDYLEIDGETIIGEKSNYETNQRI